ncbi:MAG: CoB--CoM heterodisulfide reductase iron-sulfur subunit B family protein [candidate division WOR-3 bacterium]
MKYLYYPGCTLYTKAKDFDNSIRAVSGYLGIDLKEMPNWYCCGTVATLTVDYKIGLLSPLRNLAKARKENMDLITTCSACYNVLKRTNFRVNNNKEELDILNDHLGESYDGGQVILHLLEVFRDRIGFDRLREKVKKRLAGLKIAPYYGCLLLRPQKELNFDDPENPTLLDQLFNTLGATVIDHSFKGECCGAYLIVNAPDLAIEASYRILKHISKKGAEAVATSCPLCHYNLDALQAKMKEKYPDFVNIPIFYFTQLMAVSFGLDETVWGLSKNKVETRSVLIKHKLLS